MPCDMAVEWPHSWVVRIVLHDQIPIRLDHLHITALRGRVIGDRSIPCAKALLSSYQSQAFLRDNRPVYLCENKEVVTMQMHGMRGNEVISNNHSDRGVVVDIVHVPLLNHQSVQSFIHGRGTYSQGHMDKTNSPLLRARRLGGRNLRGRTRHSCKTGHGWLRWGQR